MLPTPLLLTTVVLATLLGGWRSGALSSALAFAYLVHVYGPEGQSGRDLVGATVLLAELATVTVAAVVLTHLLRLRWEQRAASRQERLTQQLSDTRHSLGLALSAASMLAWEFNPLTKIMTWSSDAQKLLGGPCHNEDDLQRLINPEDFPVFANAWVRALSGQGELDVEYRVVRDDGTTRWFATKGRASPGHDAEGLRLSGVTFEITERKQTEHALRETEQRFRVTAETVPDVLFTCLPDGRCDYISQRWYDYTGLPSGSAVGFGWTAALHPDDADRADARWRRAIRSGEPWESGHRVRGVDGSHRWFLARARPLRDKAGVITRWFGCATDIHEQTLASEKLRESEERCRLIGDLVPFGLWTADAEGLATYISPTYLSMLGVSDLEEFRAKVYELIHPEDLPRLRASWETSIQNGAPSDLEFRIRGVDGEYRTILSRGRPVRDAQGRVVSWVGMHTDLTEFAKAREGRRELEEQYRTSFDLAAVGECQCDPYTGRFLRVNRKLCEILGYSEDELLGLSFLDLTHPEDREANREAFQHFVKGEAPEFNYEKRMLRKEGTPIWVSVNCGLVRDANGVPVRTVAVLQDITRPKEMVEQLRELNEGLEAKVVERTAQLRMLASEITHAEQSERRRIAAALHDDLAQMLVIGKMKLASLPPAADTVADKTLSEVGDCITQALQYTRGLMHDLVPPMLYDLGLGAAIGGLVERLHQQHGLKVEVEAIGQETELADDLRAFLFATARELLVNVVKYAQADSATVRVTQTQERITLLVEDDGVGFDPSALSWKPSEVGGFGLFQIREKLGLLDGSIKIDSEPGGGGTTISVTVPVRQRTAGKTETASAPEALVPPPPATVARNKDGIVRVLLVDDHELVRQGVAGILTQAGGFEVVGQAADGIEAVDLARRLQPDVIIMDISLPRLNGIEATRRITKLLPQVRVIGLSTHAESDVSEAMKLAGAIGFISKTSPSEDLISALRRQVGVSA